MGLRPFAPSSTRFTWKPSSSTARRTLLRSPVLAAHAKSSTVIAILYVGMYRSDRDVVAGGVVGDERAPPAIDECVRVSESEQRKE